MTPPKDIDRADLSPAIGSMPYRMALAGGWIDQPFVSKLNPEETGSMVVVQIHPDQRFMDRAGMATGTRHVANRLWNNRPPVGDPATLVRQLYAEENQNKPDPSGSQDMIGLLYTGISRLDYSIDHEGGYFPKHIERNHDPAVAKWIETHIHLIPVAPRPAGYNPLETQHLTPALVARLGKTGRDCFDALLARDINLLGQSFNDCMAIWETMLPCVVRHPTLELDLMALLRCYQMRYPGAMYSGCGGGYLYVASAEPVPGAFRVRVKLSKDSPA